MRARFWMLTLLASFSVSASAATYRCSNSSGQVYYSDRPCAGDASPSNGSTRIGSVGPAATQAPPLRSYTPSVPKPPDHARYLTGQCAQMEEAVRTAPARGVSSENLRSLHEDYRNKCEYEVRAAQERAYADKRELDRTRVEQRQAAAAHQAEENRQDNQCANMRAVIADKRANMPSLDARQRELLQTMQENYNRSCLNRH
ncbi:protein of unknown function [Roseateles sp. YR242]|uniref:DUF4124 domain-containing protein n=1 Tax=Roseateles sp. YR242 TaxID=1855305 RepID=UPI0008C5B3F7|nr:DUF4124 domain-containing protein [Roseateles sp. YR242]SEK76611.1 protein of unknown function [Roseateles sp. YR242]